MAMAMDTRQAAILKLADEVKQSRGKNTAALEELRAKALEPGGLVNRNIRGRAWPALIAESRWASEKMGPLFMAISETDKDFTQVQLDVNRTFGEVPYEVTKRAYHYRTHPRRKMRKRLTMIVNAAVQSEARLRYYQGFHDVCRVLVYHLDNVWSLRITLWLIEHTLSQYMGTTLGPAQEQVADIIHIVGHVDPSVYDHLRSADLEPLFALSWVLTLFAHVLNDNDCGRVFDVLLCSPPEMALYVAAAVVVHRRNEILACECEFSELHGLLSKMPRNMPIISILKRALKMVNTYPPSVIFSAEARAAMSERSKVSNPTPTSRRSMFPPRREIIAAVIGTGFALAVELWSSYGVSVL